MNSICVRGCILAGMVAWGMSRLEAQADLGIYAEGLQAGWENWSWAATANSSTVVHGGGTALAVTADAWEAAYFHHAALDATQYTNLVFWIHGGASGGQRLLVQGLLSGAGQGSTNLPALPANTWQQFSISLQTLGVDGANNFDGFWIQDRSGTTQPTFYLDDMVLLAGTAKPPGTNTTETVTVDAQRNRRAISPGIYGVAFATAAQVADLNAPLNRSGGNSESRYNWQINAHNRGADWYFESLADSPATAGAEADSFITDSRSGGAEPMLTVPMVGWVAKLGPSRARLASFSIAKYGAQTGSDSQWFPDAGNGVRASDGQPITGNDPNDANTPADADFTAGWVQHLTNRWGSAGAGGVRWYLADNEPSLWHSTHRDVHPAGATMAEVRDKFLEYAARIKAVDAGARVAGPEEWGWSGYFYSGYDQQAGAANGWTRFPDRSTNGGWDYLPWFLDQARQRDTTSGQRLLDLFTVHYYPQGGEFSSTTSTAMQARRNRSTRSLWDPTYTDETWISDRVRLIPRLKEWVAAYYPGTPIGITEYNWGAESHMNGATAQADVLGIFGREGLDVATRWTTPDTGTPVYNAMKFFRNYDGAKSTFGDTSVYAGGPNPDQLSVFAAERAGDGALTVLFVHKRPDTISPVTLSLTNFPAAGTAPVWQLKQGAGITRLADASATNSNWTLLLPAQSLTLLVVPAAENAPRLRVGGWPSAGQLELVLEGTAGRRYVLESATELGTWTPLSTNTLLGASASVVVATTHQAKTFFRTYALP